MSDPFHEEGDVELKRCGICGFKSFHQHDCTTEATDGLRARLAVLVAETRTAADLYHKNGMIEHRQICDLFVRRIEALLRDTAPAGATTTEEAS